MKSMTTRTRIRTPKVNNANILPPVAIGTNGCVSKYVIMHTNRGTMKGYYGYMTGRWHKVVGKVGLPIAAEVTGWEILKRKR